jgi:hypothetical protein
MAKYQKADQFACFVFGIREYSFGRLFAEPEQSGLKRQKRSPIPGQNCIMSEKTDTKWP